MSQQRSDLPMNIQAAMLKSDDIAIKDILVQYVETLGQHDSHYGIIKFALDTAKDPRIVLSYNMLKQFFDKNTADTNDVITLLEEYVSTSIDASLALAYHTRVRIDTTQYKLRTSSADECSVYMAKLTEYKKAYVDYAHTAQAMQTPDSTPEIRGIIQEMHEDLTTIAGQLYMEFGPHG